MGFFDDLKRRVMGAVAKQTARTAASQVSSAVEREVDGLLSFAEKELEEQRSARDHRAEVLKKRGQVDRQARIDREKRAEEELAALKKAMGKSEDDA